MEKLSVTTERLLIRNLKTSDLADFYAYRSNPEITKYQGFDVMTIQQAKDFIDEQKDALFGQAGIWIQFGIENKLTQKIIGDCAIRLDQYDSRIAEIGITVSHLEQKKGYAKETLAGLLNYLFAQIKVHRIVETVDAENIASINLLKSIGFRQEAHFIENIFFKGKWGSELQFAMLRREWELK